MGISKIRDQIEMFDALDSKTGVIAIVEILGFLLLAAAEATTPIQLSGTPIFSLRVVLFFGIGLFCSFLSTVFGLLALRVREFAIGFDYEKLVGGADLDVSELKTVFLGDLVASVRANKKILDEKVTYAKIASLLVLVGLLCYTIVVAQVFMCFVRRG
ncbi:MAG: hypothetical protein WBM24_03605 [Candidatus Sulfotelmatobacter sp.]